MIKYINDKKELVNPQSGMLVPCSWSVKTHKTIQQGWTPEFVIEYINKYVDSLSENEYIVIESITNRISIMVLCDTRAQAIELAKKYGARKILNPQTRVWEHTSCWGALFQLLTQ